MTPPADASEHNAATTAFSTPLSASSCPTGTPPTTIASVAAEAGVSVETVYKAFGNKAALVAAIWERGLAGRRADSRPRTIRSDASHESDPREVIRHWGRLTSEVAPLVAPILLLIRAAAATDPDMARLLVETDRQRLKRMQHNARTLAGHLRPGMTPAAAGEIMWTYSSPDLYDLLVLRRRWSLRRYGQFVADSLTATLLP